MTLDSKLTPEMISKVNQSMEHQARKFTAVMNKSTLGRMTDTIRLGDNRGVDIVTSHHVPYGEVLMVDTSARPFKRDIDTSFTDKFREDMLKQLDHILFRGMFRGWDYQPEVTPYDWRQRINEGVLDWGNRLTRDGVIDVPEIRIAYQKAVWGAPVAWFKRKFRD